MTSPPSDDRRAPRVSVFMPVYNAEPFLAEAVESVLGQSLGDFELLVHDDGSTDGSAELLRRYAAQDPRVVVSAGANQGNTAASNLMIGRARAPYVARMDADDVCLPHRLERQVAYLDAHPDCVVLGGCETTMDEQGRPIHDVRVPLTHAEIDANNLRGCTAIRHPTVMMRREAVLRAGGYHPDYRAAGDQELWLRMAEIGQLANLPDILVRYRLHDRSISGARGELQARMCRQACEAAWARRGLSGIEFGYSEWRMGDTAESRLEFHLRYGWQAWNNGYRGTWRHYALRSVRTAPLSRDAWMLLIAGALRRPATPRGSAA